MPAVRDAWTDERLDDLNVRVDRGFDRVDERFKQVDQRFDHVDAEIRDLRGELNGRIDSLQRTLILGFASMSASIVGALLVVAAH
jgi:hypothetical protein